MKKKEKHIPMTQTTRLALFGPVFVVAVHLCLYIISQYMYNTKKKKNILMAQTTHFNASFGPVFVVAAYFVPLNIR